MTRNSRVRNFSVTEDDIDFLMNDLLESETPKTTRQMARTLITQRLKQEQAALEERFKNTRIYNPADSYDEGEQLVFTALEMRTGTVTAIRDGVNPDYGDFQVLRIAFEDAADGKVEREFAANMAAPHALNEAVASNALMEEEDDPDKLIEAENGHILRVLHEALRDNPSLMRVAGYWFPKELVIECDIGTMHLSEAVLDMAGGGPLSPEAILEQIGGIGDAPQQLQVFSLNLGLNDDDRFDEVGSSGRVLWYLKRMEPDAVQEPPALLQYTPIDYDEDLLSDAMFDLETELDDEYTDIEFEGRLPEATSTLIYSHRRAGTLPLNAKNQAIFPEARTPRIYVELVDESDGETFDGWVVHGHRYVYGLLDYYTKHHLPVGAFVTVKPGERTGQIIVSHEGYKPRTEWIRILTPKNKRIAFENKKRQIGAEFDDLILIGIDDLAAVDELAKSYENRSLASIIRDTIYALSSLTPQGTVHAVTLYSAVNAIRRCPPGPIFATLTAHPDFEAVGDHYWKLSDND